MASTDAYSHRCIPGITFFKPMFAVLRTPQRIFFAIAAHHNGSSRRTANFG
jgi:hypothetical protein